MTDISKELASAAVKAFLASQYDKKTETEQKQLIKAIESNDYDKVSELNENLANAKDKYSAANWIADAATRMSKQLNFGTHISKGVHPDAKGDNISFQATDNLPKTLVGTHSIESHYIDANGNAAALPLAAFFDFEVNDNIKIRDLILEDNTDFIASLASESSVAKDYHHSLKTALQNIITQPSAHERNKQTLWVTNAYQNIDLESLDYNAIVPLYPSVLTHEVYQRINHLKFSDENKAARDNRFKKTAEQKRYVTLNQLATLQLGGTKPQNVSLLMSKQGGRNYLLPSLPPPKIADSKGFRLSKFANSLFGTGLQYHAREAIEDIFKSVREARNIVDIREARKCAIDEMLFQIFSASDELRSHLPAGWSKDSNLERFEKLWLDPKRADLEGEEDFKAERELNDDWHKRIIHSFARWLNALLQAEFKEKANDFGDPEHLEWEREIEEMIKRYERAGKGVFL